MSKKSDWRIYKWAGGRGVCTVIEDPWKVFNLPRTVSLEQRGTLLNCTEEQACKCARIIIPDKVKK